MNDKNEKQYALIFTQKSLEKIILLIKTFLMMFHLRACIFVGDPDISLLLVIAYL